MPIMRFDPPGFVDDLSEQQKVAWSDWIAEKLDEARAGTPDPPPSGGPRDQFFNPLVVPPAADAVEKDISWTAFPRIVRIMAPSQQQAWKTADASRDRQDEYCEWSIRRDSTGKIVRVEFTSEGPEYWRFLAAVNPARLLALYREHVSAEVQEKDLFTASGDYIPRNRWNNSTQDGAMHLIQRANTLGAEIELAAAATVMRRRNGKLLTNEQELIACGGYGEPERFSDPHIGAEVNALARSHADITLANPVGLCLAGLNTQGWVAPDGSNPGAYWKVTRGTLQKAVRAVYQVPAAKEFKVSDIKINGRPIEFGGQIAEFITIKLTGLATRIGKSTVQPVDGCVGNADAAADVADVRREPSVAEVLARGRGRAR